MDWKRLLFSDTVPCPRKTLDIPLEVLPEELQSDAKELKFDPLDIKYTTLCGRLRCNPRTTTLLALIHGLLTLLLVVLALTQVGLTSSSGTDCEYCVLFFVSVLAVLFIDFLVLFLFLFMGVLKNRPGWVRLFFYYQGFLTSVLLILALIIFCATFGPFDERRLFGEFQPPVMITLAVICFLALPFQWVLILYVYLYRKLIADMHAEEDVVKEIKKALQETPRPIIQETAFWKPQATNGGGKIVDKTNVLPNMVTNGSSKELVAQNGVYQPGPSDRRVSAADSQRSNPAAADRRRTSQESDNVLSYLEAAEQENFPTMPYSGYQGYRHMREMDYYDTQMMEIQKKEMMKKGLSEAAAEKVAEAAAAKRVEKREQREKEENENQTYTDVVEEAEAMEEEQTDQEPQNSDAGQP